MTYGWLLSKYHHTVDTLSICVSVYLPIHLSAYPSTFLSIYISIYLSISPFWLSKYLSIYPSIYLLYPSVSLSVCSFCLSMSVWIFICMSFYPSSQYLSASRPLEGALALKTKNPAASQINLKKKKKKVLFQMLILIYNTWLLKTVWMLKDTCSFSKKKIKTGSRCIDYMCDPRPQTQS